MKHRTYWQIMREYWENKEAQRKWEEKREKARIQRQIAKKMSDYEHENYVIVSGQGRLFKVKVKGNCRLTNNTSKRGKVNGFSDKSRKRILELIATMNYKAMAKKAWPLFITLTYPKTWPTMEESKRHLKNFIQRMRNRFKGFTAIWKLEFQKRGAPHYHFVVFGLSYWNKEEVRSVWSEIIGEVARTNIQKAKSQKGALCYATKMFNAMGYMTKKEPGAGHGAGGDPQGGARQNGQGAGAVLVYAPYLHESGIDLLELQDGEEWQGRVWGIVGRENIVYEKLEFVKISFGNWFFSLKRCARKVYSGIRKDLSGFSLFVGETWPWLNLAIEENKRVGGMKCY